MLRRDGLYTIHTFFCVVCYSLSPCPRSPILISSFSIFTYFYFSSFLSPTLSFLSPPSSHLLLFFSCPRLLFFLIFLPLILLLTLLLLAFLILNLPSPSVISLSLYTYLIFSSSFSSSSSFYFLLLHLNFYYLSPPSVTLLLIFVLSPFLSFFLPISFYSSTSIPPLLSCPSILIFLPLFLHLVIILFPFTFLSVLL